jgi:hypothetical protein
MLDAMKLKYILISGIILLILAIAVMTLPAISMKTVYAYADNFTLSRRGHTVWFGIVISRQWYRESAIEVLLKARNEKIDYDWVSYNGTSYNIYGSPIEYGHGRPNDLAMINVLELDKFKKFTDVELLMTYNKLKSGDKDIVGETIKKLYAQ